MLEVEQQIDSALLELKDSNASPEDGKSLQVTEQKIERIVKALSNGVLEDDEAALQLKPLRIQKARLLAKMSEAKIPRKKADLATLRRKILDRCRDQLSVESTIWTQASMEQRKIVVRAHVAGIVADQEKSTLSTTFLPYVASVGLHGTMS